MRIKTYNRRRKIRSKKEEEMRRIYTIYLSQLLKNCTTLNSSFNGIFPEIKSGELTKEEDEENYFNLYKDYLHFANEIKKESLL